VELREGEARHGERGSRGAEDELQTLRGSVERIFD
jgi:hypothetical protein